MAEPEGFVKANGNAADAEEVEVVKAESTADEAKTEEGGTSGAPSKPKRKRLLVPAIVLVVVVVVAVLAVGLFLPGQASKLQKENYVTSAMLEKAIAVDRLSTAEFVYNGIAEHYREEGEEHNPLFIWESDDPVNYRVCYKATVKAGIDMKDVRFSVDNDAKTVEAVLPEISLSCTVDPNDMQFIPENSDANIRTAFQICEQDVENEARNTEKLYELARENLRSTIEALTQPVLSVSGYALTWGEGE